MRYLLLIHSRVDGDDDLTREELDAAHAAVREELLDRGELVSSNELATDDARVVRTDATGALVTDGPFSEGHEIVGGYYVVECADPGRALEIAARFVESRSAAIEVRRLMHPDGPLA